MGCALIKWLYCRMLSKLRMHKECGWYKYGIFFFDTIENLIEFYIFYCKINLFYMSFISLDFLGPIEPKIQMSTNMKFKYLV